MRYKRSNIDMVLLGIMGGALSWVLEAVAHIYVFKEKGSLFRQVFFLDIHELWMRSLISAAFIVFGIYAQVIVNRRRSAENKVQSQNEFFKTVIESLTYPFYVVDIDNYEIKIANASARQGKPLDASLHCYNLTHKSKEPCSGADHFCPLDEVKRTKKSAVAEHLHYDKDGKFINVEVHGYPIFNEKGDVIQMIEYTLDITARKQAEVTLKKTLGELEKAYKKLQELDKLKSDFISTASHELKTPLTSIKSASSILLKEGKKKPEAGEQEKELLEIILRNVDRQARTVNDLLNLSRIEAGVVRMDKEKLDIANLAKEALSSFKLQMNEKNIKRSFTANHEPLYVWVDLEQIKRVLNNLVNNAVKFTPEGGRIDLKLQKEEDNVRLIVVDTGAGISKEDLDRIFDKFYRAASGKLHTKNGTGLGLSIARGIIEAHGGKIWAESIPGGGSSFYLTLPVSEEHARKEKG